MKKIDKSKILSTAYKQWLDNLNSQEKEHPHTSGTYYTDVVMNLLRCQQGVCAYTEMFLCNPELLVEKNWQNGRYTGENQEHFGQLEHFDPELKKTRFWQWENLFVIHSDINIKKSNQIVDDILKPDLSDYDPHKLLEYETTTHVFIPHTDIDDEIVRLLIKQMIDILHLNHKSVRYERQIFLKQVFEFHQLNQDKKIDRFFTAYQMTLGK